MQLSSPFANQFNNPIFQFILGDKWSYRITRHLLLNLLLIFIFFNQYLGTLLYVPNGQTDVVSSVPDNLANIALIFSSIIYIFSVLLIYLNLYVLIPAFLFQGRFTKYIIFVGILAFFYTFLLLFVLPFLMDLFIKFPTDPEMMSLGNFVDTLIMPSIFLGSTSGILILKKWILDTIRINALEKVNLQEELNQLKSQVNPHFLFNTLNNLHALTRIDPEKASQILLSLSGILRYQLYESNREKVLLTKDIENICQLLLLEKVRRDRFEYHINIVGNIDGRLLPPFLFTPFVENAIKHGASANDIATIDLKFCLQDDLLTFECFNLKPRMIEKKEIGGLGLNNIKRRLELLYPQKHILEINESIDSYYVKMIVPL